MTYRMRAAWLLLGLGVTTFLAGPAPAQAPARFKLGKPHRLRVTHTTRVKVGPEAARLQVWHAKPLERSWPGVETTFAVVATTLAPSGGEEIATRSEGGVAWTWKVSEPTAGELEFISTFELLSADRDLKTAGLEIRWADVADGAGIMEGQPALPVANEQLREVVAKIKRKERNVLDAIAAFAQWVNGNIAYDPGAAYRSEDLEAICKGRAGHCGHRATVFLALCQAAGLPARRVVGYALLNKAGGGVGVDDSNRHVWVQVNLPTLGWVEVEPAPHGSPFAIGFPFVMCPFDLQARFAVEVAKSGPERDPIVADTVRVDEVR